jgi:hypothetical protein
MRGDALSALGPPLMVAIVRTHLVRVRHQHGTVFGGEVRRLEVERDGETDAAIADRSNADPGMNADSCDVSLRACAARRRPDWKQAA